MGQIVKTWVKVLGLNDPYRNHMAKGLNGNMGQIVIIFRLIKKMYISIGSRRPMLQASDYFRVTIWPKWPMFFAPAAGNSHAKRKKPVTKKNDNLTHIKAKWQFDPYQNAVTIWPMFCPLTFSRWQFDNMTHGRARRPGDNGRQQKAPGTMCHAPAC